MDPCVNYIPNFPSSTANDVEVSLLYFYNQVQIYRYVDIH